MITSALPCVHGSDILLSLRFTVDSVCFSLFSQMSILQALKDLYIHLTPIQRVGIARHPNRPTFLDHVLNITDKVCLFTITCYSDISLSLYIFKLVSQSFVLLGMQNYSSLYFIQWVELHGDRAGYDDPAIVTGIGSIDGRSYMFIGHQKGRNTKENIERNFGMPTPHGYV